MARVLLQAGTGTLAGTLNKTADAIYMDANQELNIYLKPSSASLANNPSVILLWVLNMFQAIIVMVFAFAMPIAMSYIIKDNVPWQRNHAKPMRMGFMAKKIIMFFRRFWIVILILLLFLSLPVNAQLMNSSSPKGERDRQNSNFYPYISAADGSILWYWNGGYYDEVRNSVAIDENNNIYFLLDDSPSRIISLHPNGAVRWNQVLSNCYEPTPTLDQNNILYVDCYGNKAYAIYAENGTQKWNATQDSSDSDINIDSDGYLYYTDSYPTSMLVSLYPENGSQRWTFNANYGLDSEQAPAITYNNVILFPDASHTNGTVYAVFQNGSSYWNYTLENSGEYIESIISLDDADNSYFASRVQICEAPSWGCTNVTSLNPNGTLRWRTTLGNGSYKFKHASFSSPAIDMNNGFIYVSSQEDGGYIASLYAENGTVRWVKQTNDSDPYQYIESLIVDSNGIIYGADQGRGYIYAFYPDGTQKWTADMYAVDYGIPNELAMDSSGQIYVSYEYGIIKISGQAPPILVYWTNSFTDSDSSVIKMESTSNVTYSITNFYGEVIIWHWLVNGIDQSNNASSFTFLTSPNDNITVYAENLYGTSNSVTWNIIPISMTNIEDGGTRQGSAEEPCVAANSYSWVKVKTVQFPTGYYNGSFHLEFNYNCGEKNPPSFWAYRWRIYQYNPTLPRILIEYTSPDLAGSSYPFHVSTGTQSANYISNATYADLYLRKNVPASGRFPSASYFRLYFDGIIPEPKKFNASGNVYFLDIDNTTNPLPGAFVYINDTLNATTDSSGYYSIPNVPNGVYTLYVSRSDFTTDSKTISNAEPNNDFILKFTQGFRFVQLTDVHIGPDPIECGFNYNNTLNPILDWAITKAQEKMCQKSRAESVDKFENVVRNILNLPTKPNFVLVTGDLVQWNSAEQYNIFKSLILKLNQNNIRVYIVPGNHDRRGRDSPIPNPFFPSNNTDNYKNSIGANDYSDKVFNQSGYRFIGLDSGYDTFSLSTLLLSPTGSGLSKSQINLIRNNTEHGKTIIFMHHPAMDDDNFYNVISENREQFISLTYDNNVKLVLTGHTHESKFFNKYGNVFNNPYGSYYRYGTVSNDSITSTYKTFRSPLFVQTRSATDDWGDTLHGYLSVDIGKSLFGQINLADVKMTGKTSTPVRYLYLYSPADLHVYDEFGRHTGINATGGIENSIPDSYYFEEYKIGNTTLPAFVLLYNTTLNYSYELVSNFSRENITSDQATFNFTIEQKIRGAIITIKYNNVSINRDSKAYLRINTTQTNYTMQIDLNNDSIIETTKQPDTVETDYAPIAIIFSPTDGSTWDQGQPVTFNGSGIDREDGTLNKLTWVSDRDDVIGHGNFTTANISAGVHNITLLVNDTAGQVNTSNIIITVRDTQPPVLNIEYPPENKIFNKRNITVRGFAYDDSGILNVTVNGLQAGKENWDVILSLNEGQNIINVTAIDNKGFSTTSNRTVYYNSSLASDTEPPAAITNLTHKTGYSNVNRAWINWTWDNPRDTDFSYVIIYLDNIRMEDTSMPYFNISGLSSDANYTITIQSADIVDNINLTDVEDTGRTADNDPPPTTNTQEAIIKFDTASKDFRVYNSETGVEVSFVELPSKLRRYTLRDGAGNTLSLVLKHKKVKNGAEINVISMQYNGGAVIEAAKNTGRVEYSEKKGMPKELQQKIEVKKLFDAGAKYSARKGETEIRIKNEGQKELKQTRAGIVMLELLTDNGSLKLRY